MVGVDGYPGRSGDDCAVRGETVSEMVAEGLSGGEMEWKRREETGKEEEKDSTVCLLKYSCFVSPPSPLVQRQRPWCGCWRCGLAVVDHLGRVPAGVA